MGTKWWLCEQGLVIGAGGQQIRQLQDTSGARIQVAKDGPPDQKEVSPLLPSICLTSHTKSSDSRFVRKGDVDGRSSVRATGEEDDRGSHVQPARRWHGRPQPRARYPSPYPDLSAELSHFGFSLF